MNNLIQTIRQRLQTPFGKYLIVGGSVYVFELIVILVAVHLGAGNVMAVAIGFWSGLVVSFGLQKFVAFGDKRTHHRILIPQVVAVTLLVLFNFGFTVLVTKLLSHHLPAVVTRTLALGVTTIWNFYLYKTRIFNQPSDTVATKTQTPVDNDKSTAAGRTTKIAVITCYRYPDYIRAITLRDSLALIPGIEVITIKNKSTGVMRYLEVILAILKVRLTKHPDIYLLTFRWDLLPVVRLLSIGKPFILDELVNGIEYFVYEHKKFKGVIAKVFSFVYPIMANSARVILADTASHADASSALSKIDRRKYAVVPVSTDEKLFHYQPSQAVASGAPFRVFFYGYMLPLHGPQFVIQAAEILKNYPDIEFLIAGRIGKYEEMIQAAQSRGARITYRQWVPYAEIPELVRSSAINIAGPFGETLQAKHVINGKVYQFLASGAVTMLGANNSTDEFTNHQNCLIVPRGNAQAIADEILWAYQHQDQLPSIAAAGRQVYEAHFSNQVVAQQLASMLQDNGLLK